MTASWSRPLAQLRMPSSTTALMIICHLDILSGREGIPRLHADGQESFLFFFFFAAFARSPSSGWGETCRRAAGFSAAVTHDFNQAIEPGLQDFWWREGEGALPHREIRSGGMRTGRTCVEHVCVQARLSIKQSCKL